VKLTVKRKLELGWTRVVGGRVLRVVHDHQIRTASYSSHTEEKGLAIPWPAGLRGAAPTPAKKRTFDTNWLTASVGDIAVEVLFDSTKRILGYLYLSGSAINLLRYVSGVDKDLVAGWFATGKGIRIDLDRAHEMEPEQFIAAMIGVKYSGADVAVAYLDLNVHEEAQAVVQVTGNAFSYEAEDGLPPTADLVLKLTSRDKHTTYAHLQIPARSQDYGIQPFAYDVLLSSPEVVLHEFSAPAPPSQE